MMMWKYLPKFAISTLTVWMGISAIYAQDPVAIFEPIIIEDVRQPWSSETKVIFQAAGMPKFGEWQNYDVVFSLGEIQGKNLDVYFNSTEFRFNTVQRHRLPDQQTFLDRSPKRYEIMSDLLYKAIKKYAQQNPAKTRIAILSPYHSVYFSDRQVVTFYTFAAIHKALSSLKYVQDITILCRHDKDMQNRYATELNNRKQISESETVSLQVYPTVHRTFEARYFLGLWSKQLLKNEIQIDGRIISSVEFMQMLIDPKQDIPNAPDHVIRFIREKIQKIFSNGNPNLSLVESMVRKTLEMEYQGEDRLRKTNIDFKAIEIMMKINQVSNPLLRLAVYIEIFKESASEFKIQAAIKWAAKK